MVLSQCQLLQFVRKGSKAKVGQMPFIMGSKIFLTEGIFFIKGIFITTSLIRNP